jgi:hypothetical protein
MDTSVEFGDVRHVGWEAGKLEVRGGICSWTSAYSIPDDRNGKSNV